MITLERLESVSDDVYITDSVRDIVNLLLYKPKPYRIIYDSRYGVWGIGDANIITHYDLKYDIGASNYLVQFPEFNTFIDNERKRIRDRYFNPRLFDAIQGMLSSGTIYANDLVGGIMFYPHDYVETDESMFYPYRTEITSGYILTSEQDELETDYAPLYNKLIIVGAIKGDTV